MQFKIKDLCLASRRAFSGNYKQLDKYTMHNDSIMKKLFNDTLSGQIKGFYLVSDTNFKAYHKSTKKPGNIQLSSGYYKDGELIPCYDVQLDSFAALNNEGYPAGIYKIIE